MVGEIWDYLMRRKPLLGLLLVILALGGVMGAKIMSEHRPVVSQAQEIGVGPAPTYNNSLTLRITNEANKSACELIFNRNFSSVQVKTTAETLNSEATVRILNPSGQPVTTEQTTAQGAKQQFSDAPKNYSVAIGQGYVIEVRGAKIQVLSNLDYSVATAFLPSSATERYVITQGGIRKATWSNAEGETALYDLLKKYIIKQIEAYRAQLSDAVLNNKHLDVAGKTQIVLAYRSLKGVDQEPYREFINHLRRGGVPQISYSGQREYTVGESVDFTQLVTARDGEDGVYAADQITTLSEVNLDQAGHYTLAYRVSDSDRNTVTLNIPITITEKKVADTPSSSQDANDQKNNSSSNTTNIEGQDPVNSPSSVGGGLNIEKTTPEVDNVTLWGEQSEIETSTDITLTDQDSTTQITNTQDEETTASGDDARGISASQIVLMILGVVLLIGLIRFIFDHYVR